MPYRLSAMATFAGCFREPDASLPSWVPTANGSAKLIMVLTAVENTDEVWRLWSALTEQFGQG
jgi:hypothetical protein